MGGVAEPEPEPEPARLQPSGGPPEPEPEPEPVRWPVPSPPQTPRVDLTALEAELGALKVSALKRRARDAGVGEAELDAADDGDDVRQSVIALVLERAKAEAVAAGRGGGPAGDAATEAESKSVPAQALAAMADAPPQVRRKQEQEAAAALRKELGALDTAALRKRAAELGRTGELEAAMNADAPKEALVELIVGAPGSAAPPPSGPGAAAAAGAIGAAGGAGLAGAAAALAGAPPGAPAAPVVLVNKPNLAQDGLAGLSPTATRKDTAAAMEKLLNRTTSSQQTSPRANGGSQVRAAALRRGSSAVDFAPGSASPTSPRAGRGPMMSRRGSIAVAMAGSGTPSSTLGAVAPTAWGPTRPGAKPKADKKPPNKRGRKLTPREKKKAEEEAAAAAQAQGALAVQATMKYGSKLIRRRRQLSKMEEKTNWIAKAVFSAASRKGATPLNLLGSDVDDAAAIRLATTMATSSIQILNLTFNQIGDVGARAIAGAMQATPSLTELGLGSNLITDHGALALAQALEDEDATLTFLNLGGNMIGDRGAFALVCTSGSDACRNVFSEPELCRTGRDA